MSEEIRDAIEACFISPNVPDNNLEPANIVDTTQRMAQGLFAIAEQLGRIADCLERKEEAVRTNKENRRSYWERIIKEGVDRATSSVSDDESDT